MTQPSLLRRLLIVILVAGGVGLPAAVLGALCVGRACQQGSDVAAEVPYCSLPRDLRNGIKAGFYERRSPEVFVVSGPTVITGDTLTGQAGAASLWTSTELPAVGRVPIVFSGGGIPSGPKLPAGTQLRDIAPTLAEVMEIKRPHPWVRSGRPIEGLRAETSPRLVVEVAWKGVGSADLERKPTAWPTLRGLIEAGAGTLDGRVGSVPIDPAALATTIGTGGLPSEHGIVSALFRNEIFYRAPAGKIFVAWGPGHAGSALATIGDDLERRTRARAVIGLAGTQVGDRGLIGGEWEPNKDEDIVDLNEGGSPEVVGRAAAASLRRGGFGRDATPDLFAVAAAGRVADLDRLLARVVAAAREVAGTRVTFVVTATGSADLPPGMNAMDAREFVSRVERGVPGAQDVIQAASPAGLFLDEKVLRSAKISEEEVLRAVLRLKDSRGRYVVDDAFSSIAITLGRYC